MVSIRGPCRKLQRERDALAAAERRRLAKQRALAKNASVIQRLVPQMLWNRRSAFVTTAFSIVVGICAYYYKTQFISITSGIS